MTYEGRAIKTMPAYLSTIGANVYPWADSWHCLVGLAYVFDAVDKEDFLVYMSPGEGPDVTIKVHKTQITMLHGRIGVRLGSGPDPENDPVLKANKDGVLVVDPAL